MNSLPKCLVARCVGTLLLVLGLLACHEKVRDKQGGRPASPAPARVENRVGEARDLEVSGDEISRAKQDLGDGFIGLVPCTMANEYHLAAARAAETFLEKNGFKVRLSDPEAQAERQISAIEDLSAAGAKALVICVLDPRMVQSALKEAARKGIYIIQYAGRESAVNGIGISIDDSDLGRAAGEYAAKLINGELGGRAVVAILDYPDLPTAVVRADNIEQAIKKNAPAAVIAGRYIGGTQEKGLNSMENALQAHPDINVVVSINDAGAYGALMALEAAGKGPSGAVIVGIDAEKRARGLIRAGGMYRATVDTDPAQTGELAAEGAIKLLAGSTVPSQVRVPIKVITRESLR